MVFGFFATSGLSSADWGAAARDAKDVKAGGWVGVAMASWVVATLAILTVCRRDRRSSGDGRGRHVDVHGGPGIASRRPDRRGDAPAPRARGARAGVLRLVRRVPSASTTTWPRVSRTKWTILAAGLAWLLLSGGWVGRLFDVFSLLGGLLAPRPARSRPTMSAPGASGRAREPGTTRPGCSPGPLGSIVGLAPLIGQVAGREPAGVGSNRRRCSGSLVAFVVY